MKRELEAGALRRGQQRREQAEPALGERRRFLAGEEPNSVFGGEQEVSGGSLRVSRCLVQQRQLRGDDRTVVGVKLEQGPRDRCRQ